MSKMPGPNIITNATLLSRLATDSLTVFTELTKEYPNICYLRFPGNMILLSNPDYIMEVLKTNFMNYRKSNLYKEIKPILGEGLVTSHGDHWRRMRRTVGPEFSHKNIIKAYQVMSEETEKFISLLKTRKATDINDGFMEVTLNIAGRAFFGEDVDKYADRIKKALEVALVISLKRAYQVAPLPLWVPTGDNKKLNASTGDLVNITRELIAEYKKNPPVNENTLTRLLQAKDPETGRDMLEKEVQDEVITLLLAGHETTSNSLMWTVYNLCKNPKIKNELSKQVRDQFGKEVPGADELSRVPLLRQVLLESMRLNPPIPAISRTPLKDQIIDGHKIPKNSIVMCPQFIMHRHDKFWENPLQFDPNRFSAENEKTIHPGTYFPFAQGPRKCIGEEFAMYESQLILCRFIQNFDFELEDGFEPQLNMTITLNSKNGLRIKLKQV